MSDTFLTSSPHWAWYITLYFFVGGIAGGSFFIASLLQLFGRPEDRAVVRLGYYVACIGAILGGLLLTLDLTRPERFWHMLFQSNTGTLMFKGWSPMSVGAWGLLLFGFFAALATLGALAEQGRLGWGLRRLSAGLPAAAIACLGSLFGFFLAGYTGVLLSVTNRPIWADTNFLGALFLFSGVSTASASLILLSKRLENSHPGSLEWLSRLDRGALSFELLALVVLLLSLGSVAQVLVGWWGVVLALGVVGAGILAPLILESRSLSHGGPRLAVAAGLVLLGGLLLRVVVIFSSEEIHALGSGVANL